jgi:hypothetical protein
MYPRIGRHRAKRRRNDGMDTPVGRGSLSFAVSVAWAIPAAPESNTFGLVNVNQSLRPLKGPWERIILGVDGMSKFNFYLTLLEELKDKRVDLLRLFPGH